MKNRKVLNLRTHLGGLHGKTSYDADKDKLEMTVTPVGVEVKKANGAAWVRKAENGNPESKYTLLEPWSNCLEVALYADEEA